jgi:hypothetical protein
MPSRPNFPIPENIHAPLCCLEIQVPDDPTWKSVVQGLLYELQYWFNWQRDEAKSGKECAAVWKEVYNAIDWNLMACKNNDCCQEPAIIKRINPDTGNVEQSTDGGVTWTPAPGGIQSVIVQPVPPVTSGVAANKCDAAANVAGQVDVWIDQVSTDFTTAVNLTEFGIAVLEAILIAVLAILTLGALTPLEALVLPTLGAALGAAWTAGKAAFDDYWTDDIKQQILCAAYCNIGADGSFTDAQFSAFWHEINGELPAGPPKMLFMGFLSSVGFTGLNAMAASGVSADADCSDCVACLECTDKFVLYYDTGTDLSRHEGYIEITSVESALTGSQSVAITTNNADNCCYVLQTTDQDGNPVGGLNAYVPCGTAIPAFGAAFGHSGINCTILVNTVLYYSNNHEVFTIRIYLSDEPC